LLTGLRVVRSATFVISICLMLGASSVLAWGTDAGPPISPEASGQGAVIAYHKLTAEEAGVLSSPLPSESVGHDVPVIGGHGTGYMRPDADSLSALVGELNVAEDVYLEDVETTDVFDLSESPSFPIVGDQARQSSCSAWATSYYAYGYLEAIDMGWTDAKTGAPEQLLSPAWTYNKVNGGRDSGSSLVENFEILLDWGSATMATMPYTDQDYLEWGSAPAFREAPLHRTLEYFVLEYGGATTIDSIKSLVLDGVPVTFGIDAYQYTPGFADGNYVITSFEYSSSTLNHAQTVVGFDDSVTDDGEVGAFRVVNSWGGDWGDDGYYWISYDAIMELGVNGLFDSAFVSDKVDYSPELVAVWHFDDAPSRSAEFEVGIGPSGDPDGLMVPYVAPYRSSSHTYPTFMTLDLTDFKTLYDSGVEDFFLTVGASPSRGTVSSFRIEMYEGAFIPGAPTQVSGQSPNVKVSTPGTVSNTLEYYLPIGGTEALDAGDVMVDSLGPVRWVGVDDPSSVGGDSLQSGDVADGESTSFRVIVDGPAEVSFDWRVSSEAGHDFLIFTVDGAGETDSLSGLVTWDSQEYVIGNGAHTLEWTYSKDSATSMNADSGWVDNLQVVRITLPPVIELASSYLAPYNGEFLISPASLEDEDSDHLDVWYDWGDGSPLTKGDPGDDYSASHVYTSLDEFTLTAYAADDQNHNVSATATVEVISTNWRPQILAVLLEPSDSSVSPGEPVWFNVTVSDIEGDTVTVTLDFGDGTGSESESTAEPGIPVELSFSHSFEYGRDSPYEVIVTAVDDAEHETGVWDEDAVDLLVNSPPTADVTVEVLGDAAENAFFFDVSSSFDMETSASELRVRWDWNADGTWDSDWSTDKEFVHEFSSSGVHEVVLEVMDNVGLTDSVEFTVVVGEEAIPEFSALVLPVLAVLLIVVVLSRRRRGT